MPRLVVESQKTRRIVGQLNQGEDLIQSLQAICHDRRVRCGTVQATGVLDELSLSHYDRSGRAMGLPRQFRASMQLLLATGTITEEGGKLQVTLSVIASRQRDNGIELLGGACLAARVVTCEFVLEAFEDVLVRRELDRTTGLHPWSAAFAAAPAGAAAGQATAGSPSAPTLAASPTALPAPAPEGRPLGSLDGEPSAVEASKPSWADSVMASVRAAAETPEPEPDEPDEPERPVRSGDILEHQQFGRCVVQRVDSNEENVTVRLRNGRLVRLSLEVLRLRFQGEEDGHQIFATGGAATSG